MPRGEMRVLDLCQRPLRTGKRGQAPGLHPAIAFVGVSARGSNGGMETLSASQWAFLIALGGRIVPELASLDAPAKQSFRTIIDEAISARPPAMRRRLRLLLGILRFSPALRYGRRFERLAPAKQDAVLRWFQDAPVRALRQGLWAVKTLVFMGFYGRNEAGAAIGYSPSSTGNDRLHA